MNDADKSKENPKPGANRPRRIGRFLASAIDIEEQNINSVYRDYLERNNWPAELDTQVFEQIQKHLVYLLEDTQKHIKWIMDLFRRYGD